MKGLFLIFLPVVAEASGMPSAKPTSSSKIRSLEISRRLLRCLLILLLSAGQAGAGDDDWLARYRRSWNPLTSGPQLITTADVLAQGQFFIKTYVYSEFGYAHYAADWSTSTQPLSGKLSVLNPQVEFDYGLTDWLQADIYVPETSWWQSTDGGQPARDGTGIGDTTIDVRYRFFLQRPGTAWPSLTLVSYVALPTSSWFDTPATPGGFAPLGKLPSTHFGAPEVTEAIVFRKNVRPFRISGGVYYSYGIPTSNGGSPQRYGDIFQYRLVAEHVLDDQHGFGYALEFIGQHGLPFRVDGASITAGNKNFGVLGVQPTVEYNVTDRVIGSLGVAFTVAGERDIAAIYPNLSLYYYFGTVTPR